MKRKEEHIELVIEALAFEGVAVARHDGKVYFVKGALPGERILARVIKKKKSYAEGQVLEIFEKSPHRIVPPCRYFGVCGGCSWQNLKYEEQLYWKKSHVEDAFQRIGKIDFGHLDEIIPAEYQFEYRNKMEFSFGTSRWITQLEIDSEEEVLSKDFALGLHIPGRFDKVLDIESCKIQSNDANPVLNVIRAKSLELNLKSYDLKRHTGFLRSLLVRKSVTTNDLMIVLITCSAVSEAEKEFLDWFETKFVDECPEVHQVIHAENNSFSPVADGKLNIIKGIGYLTENILGVDFRISPFSFFQTNSYQLNSFIAEIIKFTEPDKSQMIWDLYCGTGSISLPLSNSVKSVLGIELIAGSVLDAVENARLNGINNVEFHCLDLHSKGISDTLSQFPKPDTIVIDPPRSGVHQNLIKHLLDVSAERIVYVSCNPATQARDCQLLSEKYSVVKMRPVDMFPQTYHIENIALLELKH